MPCPTAVLRADGAILAADAQFRDRVEPIWRNATPLMRRRVTAALRLTRRRGALTLRLGGGLQGWEASLIRTAEGTAVSLSDAPGRIDAAINGLMAQAAVEAEGFCELDRRGRWRWLSPRLEADALLGRPAPRALAAAARHGRPVVALFAAPSSPDDGTSWRVTARPAFDSWGRPAGLVGVVQGGWPRDETEDCGRRLRAMIQAIDPGFALYDAQGRLTLASDAYYESFLTDPIALAVGAPEPDWSPMLRIGAPQRPGRGQECAFEIETAERRRWVVRRAAALDDAPNRPGGWVDVLHDVTTARRAQTADAEALADVRAAERAKQALLDSVGDELFTHAARVRAGVHALAEAGAGDFSDLMLQGVRRLFATARDIRTINLLTRAETPTDPVDASLADLIDAAVALRRDDAERAGMALAISAPQDRRQPIDIMLLALALDHLLSNALKFSRPGGGVLVSLILADDGGAAIEVADEGVGVAPEKLAHLQRAFVQDEADATLRAYEGLGLGLAICRAVMELHGGRLTLNGAPGRGAQARLHLPPPPNAEVTPACAPILTLAPTLAPPPADQRCFDLAPTPMALVDAAMILRRVNRAAELFFGAPAAMLIGRPLARLLSPQAAPISRDQCFRRRGVDRPWRLGSGADVWARLIATPAGPDGLVLAWEDATDLCRLEELAAATRAQAPRHRPGEEAAQLRAACDVAPIGLILWDEDDRLVYWNPRYAAGAPQAAARLAVGLTAAQADRLAVATGELACPDPGAWLREQEQRRDRAFSVTETPLRQGRWLRLSQRRARDGALVGTQIDVTQRKQAERRIAEARAAAAQADAQKRNFLAMISHELRTPLNAVIGFADLLKMDPHVAPRAQKIAVHIANHGGRLQQICDDMIDYAHIESGAFIVTPERTPLSALWAPLLAVGAPLRIADDAPDPVLLGDGATLGRALLTLSQARFGLDLSATPVTIAIAADWTQGLRLTLTAATIGVRPKDRLANAIAQGLLRLNGAALAPAAQGECGPALTIVWPSDRLIALSDAE